MKCGIAVLVFVLFAVSCGSQPATTNTAPAPSPVAAATTSATDHNDPIAQARSLVGIDLGGKVRAEADDIHVKRAAYLLTVLAEKTGESPFAIAASTDATADMLEKDYGRRA